MTTNDDTQMTANPWATTLPGRLLALAARAGGEE